MLRVAAHGRWREDWYSMTEREYVLGTGDDELARLALQNRLWSDASTQAWRQAELHRGDRVLAIAQLLGAEGGQFE